MEESKTPKGEFVCHVQMCEKVAMNINSISEILRIKFHLKMYEINVKFLDTYVIFLKNLLWTFVVPVDVCIHSKQSVTRSL